MVGYKSAITVNKVVRQCKVKGFRVGQPITLGTNFKCFKIYKNGVTMDITIDLASNSCMIGNSFMSTIMGKFCEQLDTYVLLI